MRNVNRLMTIFGISIAFVGAFTIFRMMKVNADIKPDVKTALPTQVELTGFRNYKSFKAGGEGSYIVAKRQTDELSLEIWALVFDSEAEAQRRAPAITGPSNGMPNAGAPSGRRIGQDVWRSKYMGNSQEPRGSFDLIVRDGRSVIVVRLAHKLTRDAKGKPVFRKFSEADLTFAEDLAIGCLSKLKAMSLTSGEPVVQAAMINVSDAK